jgi:hypothetical protein
VAPTHELAAAPIWLHISTGILFYFLCSNEANVRFQGVNKLIFKQKFLLAQLFL